MGTPNNFDDYREQAKRLKAAVDNSRQRLERGIKAQAVLQDRIDNIHQAIDRRKCYRIFVNGEIEKDNSLELLRQQFDYFQPKQVMLEQAIEQERGQLRLLNQELWQLSVKVAKQKQRRAQQSKAATGQSDLLTGHVVPSHNLPNPLRDLRRQPRRDFKSVLLPLASMGLIGEILLAQILGLSSVAFLGILTLVSLWIVVAIWVNIAS